MLSKVFIGFAVQSDFCGSRGNLDINGSGFGVMDDSDGNDYNNDCDISESQCGDDFMPFDKTKH